MSAASKSIPLRGLKRRALSLGAAKAFDHAMQFLLPVVLVRCLDAATFGEYRLLWLAVGTLMYVATFNVPQSLYVFLPRSDARLKRLYINQALLFMGLSGLACAWLVSPWNPWLPESLAPLAKYGALVPAFVALWMTAVILDFLPAVDERVAWQSVSSIALSVLRVAMLALGAFLAGSMEALLWLLVAYVLVRLAVLAAYIARFHGLHRPVLEGPLFADQVRRAWPLGLSNAFYGLRWQADQWIAAHLFTLTSFAAFSVAGVFGPVVNVFRASVNEAFLPSMSRLQAAGDLKGMLELNSRANVMVGTLLFPLLCFVWAFAADIVTVVYTAQYLEAAPVMRLYLVAFCVMVVEVGSLVLLLDEGRYQLKVNAAALAFSVAASIAGAHWLGLPGAALGGVLAIYLDRGLMLRRISVHSGIPVRRLQNWGGLALALAYGAFVAILAWVLVQAHFMESHSLTRVISGGTVLAVAYLAALAFYKLRKGKA